MTDTLRLPIELAPTHPAFDGHFPGQPLLPGVVLLSEALEALVMAAGVQARCRIANIKFLAPVRPGARLELRANLTRAGERRSFELWRLAPGDHAEWVLAATGQLADA